MPRYEMTRGPTHVVPALADSIHDPAMARGPERFLLRRSNSTDDATVSVFHQYRTGILLATAVIITPRTFRRGRKSEIPGSDRAFRNNHILGRNLGRNTGRSYHDNVLVFVLSVTVILVLVELNLHLRDVFKVAFLEERIPGRGGFEIALQTLFVREVGAPFHQLGAGAATLVGRMRVEDIEHCAQAMWSATQALIAFSAFVT